MNEPDGIVNDDKQKYDDEQQSFLLHANQAFYFSSRFT